jgi:hypothetical protein
MSIVLTMVPNGPVAFGKRKLTISRLWCGCGCGDAAEVSVSEPVGVSFGGHDYCTLPQVLATLTYSPRIREGAAGVR